MRNFILPLFASLALGLAGCCTRHPIDKTAPPIPKAVGAATNLAELKPEPYTRISSPDTNTVQLQIAVRKLVPAHRRGPAILLVGTSHIGDADYYHALQKLLDAQTLVLFEGVNAEAHPRHVVKPGAAPSKDKSPTPPPHHSHTNEGFSMQSALAESLGLVFQLDAIDYDRTNFLNSDLSIFQIQGLMIGDTNATPGRTHATPDRTNASLGGTNATPAGPGEEGVSSPSLDALLQIMDGSSFLGSLVKVGMQFISANPKMQAITKLTLIETLGGLKGDLSKVRGLPPDMKKLITVLIQARNQNVVDDLKTELKRIPRSGSISVFYGTGHMDDMETRIIRDLDYRPAGDIWFTAFSVDLGKTGLSSSEVQTVRTMVKWQLSQMQQ